MIAVTYRKIFFGISGALVLASIFAIIFIGLPFGIDFTGGAVTQVSYTSERPARDDVQVLLDSFSIGDYEIRPTGENGYMVRSRDLSDEERQTLVGLLSINDTYPLTVERFSSIGPSIGGELKSKALYAIFAVSFAIVLFVAFSFRKTGEGKHYGPSAWWYGLVAIIALVHDIILPTGLFALLGGYGFQVDVLFVMALLAILGFSVNDTIVVLDRVRENLQLTGGRRNKESFEELVGRSLSQTYARSVNTSLTTLLVLLTLFFLGGESVHSFTLTLIVGVIAGTYASIFLASPLLIYFEGSGKKKTN